MFRSLFFLSSKLNYKKQVSNMVSAMPEVHNLDTKNKTVPDDTPSKSDQREQAESFFSGDLGVSANLKFHINSPWRAFRAWIGRLAA
jgi:hypothetical protein